MVTVYSKITNEIEIFGELMNDIAENDYFKIHSSSKLFLRSEYYYVRKVEVEFLEKDEKE